MPLQLSHFSGEVTLWVCSGFATMLLLLRLLLRVRKWPWSQRKASCPPDFAPGMGEVFVASALAFNMFRTAGEYFINIYGTLPVVEGNGKKPPVLTPEQEANLALAGKIIIPTRIAFLIVLWSLKMSLVDLFRVLLRRVRHERLILAIFYSTLWLTLAVSVFAIFLECQPLRLYWESFPNVDSCSNSVLWVATYEASNIVTDVMLLVLPIHLVSKVQMPILKRLWLYLLFGSGALLIGVNVIRLITGVITGVKFVGGRRITMLWGSIEIVVATLVSTLPSINVLLRHRFAHDSRPKRRPTRSGLRGSVSPSDIPLEPYQPGPRNPSLVTADSLPSIPQPQESPSPVPELTLPESFSRPRPRSTNSLAATVGMSNHDALTVWYTLEQDRPLGDQEAPSPELEDAEVHVATEVARNAPRTGQRPRIVTIPPRMQRVQSRLRRNDSPV